MGHLDTDGRVIAVLRTLATAAAVTLLVGGCSAKSSRESGTKVTRPSEMVAVEGPAPVGRFFVKAGPNSLDKLGTPAGSDPHVSPDCRILYLRVAEANPQLVNEIMLFDPSTGAMKSITKGATVAAATWGPNGEILVLKREASGPALVVMQPNGSVTTIKPEQPDVGNPQWGRSGWIATDIAEPQQPPTGTLILNPTTGARSVLKGWLPLAWSPDGQQLLVTEATHGTMLAIVELPDFTKTRNVGVSDVGTVWDAVWLPAK